MSKAGGEVVQVDFGAPGLAPDGCAECGVAANDYHYPGCSFAPYVCPGCHAVGGEHCAPGCIDAEIEAEHREAVERGDYDYVQEDDGDWERE